MMRKRRPEDTISSSRSSRKFESEFTVFTSSYLSSIAPSLNAILFRYEFSSMEIDNFKFQPYIQKKHNLTFYQTTFILLCCLLNGIILTINFVFKEVWCFLLLIFFAVATWFWVILLTKCLHSELDRKNKQTRFDFDQLALEAFGVFGGQVVYLLHRWVYIVMLTIEVLNMTMVLYSWTDEKAWLICWLAVCCVCAIVSVTAGNLSEMTPFPILGVGGAAMSFLGVFWFQSSDIELNSKGFELEEAISNGAWLFSYPEFLVEANIIALALSGSFTIIPEVYYEMENREEFEIAARTTITISCLLFMFGLTYAHFLVPPNQEYVLAESRTEVGIMTMINSACTVVIIMYPLRWETAKILRENYISAADMRIGVTQFLISMGILLATLPLAWFVDDEYDEVKEFMELCGWSCLAFFYVLPYLIWFRISEREQRSWLESLAAGLIMLCSTFLVIISCPTILNNLKEFVQWD